MRPELKFLSEDLIIKIISEAKIILSKLGVEIRNSEILSMLSGAGVKMHREKQRALIPEEVVDTALSSVPKSFKLFDAFKNETHDFSGDNVHFTPGSAALNLLDYKTQKMRRPSTDDYIDYVKIVSQLDYIASQSTAFIPADVPEKISDSYRLFLSLMYCKKPVVTGTFTIESFNVMRDFLIAVRGSEQSLAEKPLSIFSCCPTSPL